MARCGCADTGANSVRSMLSAQDGVKYNSLTGVFSADISTDPGNNLTLDGFGRLFVPTGAATVSVGPGILGNGSGGNPVRANVASWPYATAPVTGAEGIFVNPVGGQLVGAPVQVADYVVSNISRTYANLPVAAGGTSVAADTFAVTLTNPDPNRSCRVIIEREVNVRFTLPGVGGGGPSTASFTIDGVEAQILGNAGSSTQSNINSGVTKTFKSANLGPGASSSYTLTVGTKLGTGSATYSQIAVSIGVLYLAQS